MTITPTFDELIAEAGVDLALLGNKDFPDDLRIPEAVKLDKVMKRWKHITTSTVVKAVQELGGGISYPQLAAWRRGEKYGSRNAFPDQPATSSNFDHFVDEMEAESTEDYKREYFKLLLLLDEETAFKSIEEAEERKYQERLQHIEKVRDQQIREVQSRFENSARFLKQHKQTSIEAKKLQYHQMKQEA